MMPQLNDHTIISRSDINCLESMNSNSNSNSNSKSNSEDNTDVAQHDRITLGSVEISNVTHNRQPSNEKATKNKSNLRKGKWTVSENN